MLKRIVLENLTDLHVLSPCDYKTSGFGYTVCLYVWMSASLVSEWLNKFYSYLVFECFSIIGLCPVNMSIPTPKIETLRCAPKHKMEVFLK
jgi:hypothetical protein